jgi:hypothetical protein
MRLEWKYADDFKQVYATNSFAIVLDYDARIIFGLAAPTMQSDPESLPKADGKYTVEVILPFRALKELAIGLTNAVKDAEMRHGEIKLPKRPEDYFKQP